MSVVANRERRIPHPIPRSCMHARELDSGHSCQYCAFACTYSTSFTIDNPHSRVLTRSPVIIHQGQYAPVAEINISSGRECVSPRCFCSGCALGGPAYCHRRNARPNGSFNVEIYREEVTVRRSRATSLGPVGRWNSTSICSSSNEFCLENESHGNTHEHHHRHRHRHRHRRRHRSRPPRHHHDDGEYVIQPVGEAEGIHEVNKCHRSEHHRRSRSNSRGRCLKWKHLVEPCSVAARAMHRCRSKSRAAHCTDETSGHSDDHHGHRKAPHLAVADLGLGAAVTVCGRRQRRTSSVSSYSDDSDTDHQRGRKRTGCALEIAVAALALGNRRRRSISRSSTSSSGTERRKHNKCKKFGKAAAVAEAVGAAGQLYNRLRDSKSRSSSPSTSSRSSYDHGLNFVEKGAHTMMGAREEKQPRKMDCEKGENGGSAHHPCNESRDDARFGYDSFENGGVHHPEAEEGRKPGGNFGPRMTGGLHNKDNDGYDGNRDGRTRGGYNENWDGYARFG